MWTGLPQEEWSAEAPTCPTFPISTLSVTTTTKGLSIAATETPTPLPTTTIARLRRRLRPSRAGRDVRGAPEALGVGGRACHGSFRVRLLRPRRSRTARSMSRSATANAPSVPIPEQAPRMPCSTFARKRRRFFGTAELLAPAGGEPEVTSRTFRRLPRPFASTPGTPSSRSRRALETLLTEIEAEIATRRETESVARAEASGPCSLSARTW